MCAIRITYATCGYKKSQVDVKLDFYIFFVFENLLEDTLKFYMIIYPAWLSLVHFVHSVMVE